MATIGDNYLRDQLQQRRTRLEDARQTSPRARDLERLVQEVDSALARMEQGTYGLCETCHDSIEKERILADPLARFCLDHLNSDQQRALEQDLEIAARIQRTLLPAPSLKFDGWEVHHHYAPLGVVSGDYCDVILNQAGGGSLLFALGDIAGKGVAASLLMSHLHAILRSLAPLGLSVGRLVERVNAIFCESALAGYFATLVCGRALPSGEIEVCNAGHCLPFLADASHGKWLESTGLPVGLFSDGRYDVSTHRLARGETLVLYSDGVSEAQNPSHQDYGTERLARLVKEQGHLSPQELLRACLADLQTFCGVSTRRDDQTLMVLRRTA